MTKTTGLVGAALLRDERGGVLAFVAVSMIAVLAVMALAIDLGIALTARGEAQRVADAAALAGASAFIDLSPPSTAVDEAKLRAKQWASANVVRNASVDVTDVSVSTYLDVTNDMTVLVIPDEQKVRVWVRKSGIGVFFARFLGVGGMNVQAMAAAIADPVAGEATCIKPFILFDAWHEGQSDANNNHMADPGEQWVYDDTSSPPDSYASYDDNNPDAGTGWGTGHRNFIQDLALNTYNYDRGRIIEIKKAVPPKQGGEFVATPGIYLPWRMPDPDEGCGETGQGGDFYRANIETCNMCPIQLNTDYTAEPGGMVGPTSQGVKALLDQDPNADWDPATQTTPVSPKYPNINDSPRMMVMALAAPGQKMQGAAFPIQFNNIVTMWLEDFDDKQGAVVARFVGPASGLGSGPDDGELLKVLRLVE